MKEEINLDKIGRQTPYKVPAGFFETVTQETLAEAEKRTNKTKGKLWLWQPIAAAASVFLLLTVGYLLYKGKSQENELLAKKEIIDASEGAPITFSDTMTIPANNQKPRIVARNLPVKENAPGKTGDKTVVAKSTTPKAQRKAKPETLDEVLITLSDEELLQLTALAQSELYVYEQTFSNE